MMLIVYPREKPPQPGQCRHSPQRHTAARLLLSKRDRPHTHTHDKNNTANDHTRDPPPLT